MVKIGFIVEGYSETILLRSDSFISYLKMLNLHCETDLVINAKSKSCLYHPNGDFSKLETRMAGWLLSLEDKGAEKIFIVLDLDDCDTSYSVFKSKVCSRPIDIIIVAKRAIEAWYLADTKALATFLAFNIDEIKNPEDFAVPVDEIKRLRQQYQNRGVNDKKASQ